MSAGDPKCLERAQPGQWEGRSHGDGRSPRGWAHGEEAGAGCEPSKEGGTNQGPGEAGLRGERIQQALRVHMQSPLWTLRDSLQLSGPVSILPA